MRNKRGNTLKPLKTHIKTPRGRNECLDTFMDTLGVPIYRLTKEKIEKTSLKIVSTAIPPSTLHGVHLALSLVGATVPAKICTHVHVGSSQKVCPTCHAYVCSTSAIVPAKLRATGELWHMLPRAST